MHSKSDVPRKIPTVSAPAAQLEVLVQVYKEQRSVLTAVQSTSDPFNSFFEIRIVGFRGREKVLRQ